MTLDNFRKILDPVYVSVFVKSLEMGVITTVICLALAYPMAYFIAKFDENSQSVLILLVTIPMWINTLLRTYAWISLLSDNGIVNSFLKMIGLNPVNMMYTNFSVVMGLVCDLVPFMVIPIHTSLATMVFLLSISAFVIPVLLGGHQFVLIGNLIENQFISVGDWNFGSAISVILAIVILFMMRIMNKIDPDNKGGM